MEFHERLKELRSQKGISQSKLADAIHISRSAVAKWENGLGLPNEASLSLLADYFNVSVQDLTEDRDVDKKIVVKNMLIGKQRKIIILLSVVLTAIILIMVAYFVPVFREYVFPFTLGLILILLGIFNMQGNIASVHWYNRRRVKKEDQKAYCIVIGLGTALIGCGIVIFSILMCFYYPKWLEYCPPAVMIVGLGMMVFAQFKYNRGFFN